MTVVCNATPLINFAAINRLDILNAAFGQIVMFRSAQPNVDLGVGFHFVPLTYGKLTQRGSKLQPNLQFITL